MPHPLKPPWLLQSFQPARCHQALRNLLSSSAEASCFLAMATLLRLSLEGWPSPLAPGGQQLSTCKWENERLHYRCQTAWTPRSYRPAIVHMAFPLQKSGWAQGRLGQANSGGAGLPCEDHFHLLCPLSPHSVWLPQRPLLVISHACACPNPKVFSQEVS